MPLLANGDDPPWYLLVAFFGALLVPALFLLGRDRRAVARRLSSPILSRLFGLSLVVGGVVGESTFLYSTVQGVTKKQPMVAVWIGITALATLYVLYGLILLVIGGNATSVMFVGQGGRVSPQQRNVAFACLIVAGMTELAFQLWLRTQGYR